MHGKKDSSSIMRNYGNMVLQKENDNKNKLQVMEYCGPKENSK